MVHDFGAHEHFLEIDPQRLRYAGHIDPYTVRFGLDMVPYIRMGSLGLSSIKALHSGTEEWSEKAIEGRSHDGTAPLDFPTARASLEFIRYFQDPGLARSYH